MICSKYIIKKNPEESTKDAEKSLRMLKNLSMNKYIHKTAT